LREQVTQERTIAHRVGGLALCGDGRGCGGTDDRRTTTDERRPTNDDRRTTTDERRPAKEETSGAGGCGP
jgi:hypothetical protein